MRTDRVARLLGWGCLFLWICCGDHPAQATPVPTQDNALRVVLESARTPFSSRDQQGHPHGMAVEFWDTWSQHTGVPLHIATLPMYDALQALRQEGIDAVLEYAHAGQAPPGLQLGEPYATLAVSLFFSRKLAGIKSLEDLEGLRLGVVAASGEAEAVAERVPFGTVLVPYPTAEALVAAAILGEVHAFVAPAAVAAQYLARAAGLEEFPRLREPVLTLQVSALVRADAAAPPILATLHQGMDEDMFLERKAIELAWRGQALSPEVPWRMLGAATLVLLGVVVAVLCWNRQLQRRVRLATAELRTLNTALGDEVRTRRAAEDELARLNRLLEYRIVERTKALGDKAAQLQRANERLRRMDEAKTAFLAAVSHELRTPLTSLRGFSKLIRKDFEKSVLPCLREDPAAQDRALRILQNLRIMDAEGDRLSRLINDYLDLSRIEAGRMTWRDVEIQPEDCVQHAVQAVAGQVAEKTHLDLHVETAPDLPALYMDPDRLEQLLINLLSNALKLTPRGEVRLRTHAIPGGVRFTVQDTGPGIPEADWERIFDKFERLPQEDTLQTPDAVGAGLGLSICKQIVDHYGGSIRVKNGEARGSTFIVELPVPASLPETHGEQATPLEEETA